MTMDSCGIVVTYHPDRDVIENLTMLRRQIERVIVVDNGSSATELAVLREASATLDFALIENGGNLGIATALNIGIRHAQQAQCETVFLFDQDSQLTPGFVDTMLSAYRETATKRNVGIWVPRYVDKRVGNTIPAEREASGAIAVAMTSGSLIAMQTFAEHGLFLDDLFIDAVDHEFSLRLREAGLHIEECTDAILLHSPGEPIGHRILFRQNLCMCNNYSPVRRYYQERNKIWLRRRFGKQFPGFMHRQFAVSAKEFSKILLLEANKLPKLRLFLKGTLDGLRGRMGPLERR